MIDVLMIALQFAPVQSTGAFRSIEFAKRLPRYGIRPTVLTIDPEQASAIFGGILNPSLAEGFPEAVEILYMREKRPLVNESSRARLWRMLTTLDDTFERRFAPVLKKMLADLDKGPRDYAAVYASAPPFGASMLGATAARVLGVPYLLDMRDAWAEWAHAPQITRMHYARKRRDEARAFDVADSVVGVTHELIDLFAATHADLPTDKLNVIPNGFDALDELPAQAVWTADRTTIDIGYVGSFYWVPPKPASLRAPHRYLQYDPGTEDWSYRSPLHFFRAWAALDRIAPETGARLRFHHVGPTPDWLGGMAAEYGLADRCIFRGPLPRQDVVGFLEEMSGLLATSMKRLDGRDYCLASKSFEYLSSGRPILAFVCEGAQKRFFEGAGGCVIFDPDDVQCSALRLQELVGKSLTLPIHKAYLQTYDLDRTASQMAELMRRTAGRSSKIR